MFFVQIFAGTLPSPPEALPPLPLPLCSPMVLGAEAALPPNEKPEEKPWPQMLILNNIFCFHYIFLLARVCAFTGVIKCDMQAKR